MRRHPDPVTPETRDTVLRRDEWWCVAPRLGAETPCLDRWGHPTSKIRMDFLDTLTLDHVQEGYGRMGKRAPSVPSSLVVICFGHHLNGWATANRPALRRYIAGAESVRLDAA